MADKSFGVKDINLIGASGTPEIESPNNLNINAVNVAISTDMSIGGALTVTGDLTVNGTTTTIDTAVTAVDSLAVEGSVGIGTDNPNRLLQVDGASGGNGQVLISTNGTFSGTDTADLSFRIYANPSNGNAHNPQAQIQAVGTGSYDAALVFKTAVGGSDNNAPVEKLRIDSSGRLLVGTSEASNDFRGNNQTPQVQLEGTNLNTSCSSIVRSSADELGPIFCLAKSRSTSVGGNRGLVSNGDSLGQISFEGGNSVDFIRSASIEAFLDNNPGAIDMPGRLVFSTTADGAYAPTERLRITSAGRFGFNTTSPDYTVDINGELGIKEGQPVTWHDGSGNPAAQIYGDSSSNLIFRTGVAGMGERMRLLPAGGLTFNGDTAAANALDDYEEGTWTPTNFGATVNSGTFAATGSYTKIGNIVTVQMSQTGGNISWTAGAWLISGLPFAAAIFGSVGSATDTGPSFTSSVMIWTSSQFYIQSAGSNITSLRITATYRV